VTNGYHLSLVIHALLLVIQSAILSISIPTGSHTGWEWTPFFPEALFFLLDRHHRRDCRRQTIVHRLRCSSHDYSTLSYILVLGGLVGAGLSIYRGGPLSLPEGSDWSYSFHVTYDALALEYSRG
jgi:hypothetical protein